jgi:isopentenyldiphosphate isomerase
MDRDEILDLVSMNDEVIGQEERNIIYSRGKGNFRGVCGFICNSDKKLWIPRRHPDKKEYPLHLDASIGGHVRSGESYENAFIREAKEELNIMLEPGGYFPLTRLTIHDHEKSIFLWVYIIKSDEVPCYNTDEFVDYSWLSLEEFFTKIARGEKARYGLTFILQSIRDRL